MDRHLKYAAPLVFLVFAATLLPWRCNFPLNDDWAYALASRALAETGRLRLCDWGASTQLPHLLWGALFTKLFGFSFGALRVANLLVSAAGLYFFVRLMEEFDIAPGPKAAAALALALNPLYLVLADSFMTDQHYLLWMLAACLFYVRRLKDPSDDRSLWLAGACSAMAYLTRQLGVALPLAFTLALFLERRPGRRELAAVWALPAAAMLGFALWFKYVNGPTWASENYVGAATLAHLSRFGAFLGDAVRRVLASAMETGLLLLPLAAAFLFSAGRFRRKNGFRVKVHAAVPWLALAALTVFALTGGPLPYLQNNISPSGLGALTLGGSVLKPSGLFASPTFWRLATVLSVAGAALLVCASDLALRAGPHALRFVFAAAMLQLALSLVGAKYFDRYLLTLLPWFALAAAFAAKGVRFSLPAAGTALALYAALGWAGMKDYMAWNTAKWELTERPHPGLLSGEIAAGFDHDAWLNYEQDMAYLKSMKPLDAIGEWEWQSLIQYKALVSFAPDQRLRLLDRIEYSTPLSAEKGVLYLMALPPAAPPAR